MKTVSIYTTPTCKYCGAAKEFFKQHGVQYNEYNVAIDKAKREEMVEKTGQLGVPVIIVDDEAIIGFDEDRLTELLVAGK